MSKTSNFIVGAITGALVAAAAVLLFTPSSGDDLIHEAQDRWELTKREARAAMEEKRLEMERQFEAGKRM